MPRTTDGIPSLPSSDSIPSPPSSPDTLASRPPLSPLALFPVKDGSPLCFMSISGHSPVSDDGDEAYGSGIPGSTMSNTYYSAAEWEQDPREKEAPEGHHPAPRARGCFPRFRRWSVGHAHQTRTPREDESTCRSSVPVDLATLVFARAQYDDPLEIHPGDQSLTPPPASPQSVREYVAQASDTPPSSKHNALSRVADCLRGARKRTISRVKSWIHHQEGSVFPRKSSANFEDHEDPAVWRNLDPNLQYRLRGFPSPFEPEEDRRLRDLYVQQGKKAIQEHLALKADTRGWKHAGTKGGVKCYRKEVTDHSLPVLVKGEVNFGKGPGVTPEDVIDFFTMIDPQLYNSELDISIHLRNWRVTSWPGVYVFYQSYKGMMGVPGRDFTIFLYREKIADDYYAFASQSIDWPRTEDMLHGRVTAHLLVSNTHLIISFNACAAHFHVGLSVCRVFGSVCRSVGCDGCPV